MQLNHHAMQAGPLLLSVYLQTPTQSVMIGQLSGSSPLPAAVTVLPGAVDPQKSLIAVDDSSLTAGTNATASVALADAFGNTVLPQDAVAPILVSGVALMGDGEIPADVSLDAGSGRYRLTVRLHAVGAYELQVKREIYPSL